MKMKKYFVLAALLLFGPLEACALWGLDSVQSAAGEKVISALTIDLSGLKYYPAPKEALAPLDTLAKEATNLDKNISCSELEPFVDFVVSNAYTGLAWELPCSNGVFGAMAIGVLTNSFEERKVFCSPILPDHAVYSTLRYSKELSSKSKAIEEKMFSAPEGILTRDYSLNYDIIAPNETSGAYYCYTNTRLYVQGNVKGHRVMLTGTLMETPSSISQKGALIDAQYPGLYFYSSEKGLTLPGAGWMETTMDYYRSFTVSVELDKDRYAFATMSWLSAGWKGINVLRTHHIYEVLREIIKELQTYGGSGLNIGELQKCVSVCESLSDEEIESEYKKYCAFCEKKAGKSFVSVNVDAYKRIFNKKDLEDLPKELRRALVVQEKVRILKNHPTWSKAE
jgi:hypothetical protein